LSEAKPLVCRPAKPTDFAAVGEVLSSAYGTLLSTSYPKDLLDAALPYMIKPIPELLASGTYYVAERGPGVLSGCGGWTKASPGGGPAIEGEAHVRHFATSPQATRQGIGTSLLARCAADARASGVRIFQCFSTLNAEPFYKAFGFVTVAPIEVPMGPTLKFPGVLMRLDIERLAPSGHGH